MQQSDEMEEVVEAATGNGDQVQPEAERGPETAVAENPVEEQPGNEQEALSPGAALKDPQPPANKEDGEEKDFDEWNAPLSSGEQFGDLGESLAEPDLDAVEEDDQA